jgi:hypothetical protein
MIRRLVMLIPMILLPQAATGQAEDVATMPAAIQELENGIRLLEENDPDAQSAIELAATRIDSAIHEQGHHSVAAYHALGNAYTLSGDLGHAMLAYRRAELINPQDRRVRDSIDYVRDQVQISVEPNVPHRIREALVSWRGLVPRIWIWAGGITLFASAWIVLLAGLGIGRSIRTRNIGITLLLCSAIPITALVYEWSYMHARDGVVIVQDSVTAMSGPDDAIYDAVYAEPLQGGVEGQLLETRDGWGRLRLADGSECWVLNESYALIISTQTNQ